MVKSKKKDSKENEAEEEEEEGASEEEVAEEEVAEDEEVKKEKNEEKKEKNKKPKQKRVKKKRDEDLDSGDTFSSEYEESFGEKVTRILKLAKVAKKNEDVFNPTGGAKKRIQKRKKRKDESSSDSEDGELKKTTGKGRRPDIRALRPKKAKGSVIAIIDPSLCNPDGCKAECVNFCPVIKNRGNVEGEEKLIEKGEEFKYEGEEGTEEEKEESEEAEEAEKDEEKVKEMDEDEEEAEKIKDDEEDEEAENATGATSGTAVQETFVVKIDKDINRAVINEARCRQQAICVRKCPFHAITIARMPSVMTDEQICHRFGRNSFRLYLMVSAPKEGRVTGIIGHSQVGKSMVLNFLSGKVHPNFGDTSVSEDDKNLEDFPEKYQKYEIYDYLQKIKEENPRILIKTQYVNLVMRKHFGTNTVLEALSHRASSEIRLHQVMEVLNIKKLSHKKINRLSPGELQRVSLGVILVQRSNYLILDEPTNFLDFKHRLLVALTIKDRMKRRPNSTIVVVDHDLIFMDFICDKICLIFGESGAFGIATPPTITRLALKQWRIGKSKTTGIKFRDRMFEAAPSLGCPPKLEGGYRIHSLTVKLKHFEMKVEGAHYRPATITVMIGENGCGKTLLLELIAGRFRDRITVGIQPKKVAFSYKNQSCSLRVKGPRTVRQVVAKQIPARSGNADFRKDVLSPLRIFDIYDKKAASLTPAELQRLSIALCLGKEAEIYLIDEPSSYLDCDFRIIAAECIRNVVDKTQTPAIVAEHDLRVAAFVADMVVLFEGEAGVNTIARQPDGANSAFGKYLRSLNFTVSYDKGCKMLILNKPGSMRDYKQRTFNKYYVCRKYNPT